MNITNSTNYWTITFPSSGHQPITVFCHAPSDSCPLSTVPACNALPTSNVTAKGSSSLLTAANGSTCTAGSPSANRHLYGLQVSQCIIAHMQSACELPRLGSRELASVHL